MFKKSDDISMLFTSFNYLHGKPTGLSVPLRKEQQHMQNKQFYIAMEEVNKQNLNGIEKKLKLKENFENI